MTADGTDPGAQRAATDRGATSAAKAYERRSRRENAVASGRLTRTGSPIAAAMSRVPFVATIILLLAAGIVGVLWLNTMSDATALQTTASRIRQAATKTDIQALQADVNTLQDPARLAAAAGRLGLVPAGDAALLEVGADGKGTVIGTPTPVPGRPPAAPVGVAPATAAAPVPTTAPAAITPPVSTTPVSTTPVSTTPVSTTPVTTTPATTTPATTTPATTTPATSDRVTTTPAAPPVKSSTARTSPVQRATTTSTGAGR